MSRFSVDVEPHLVRIRDELWQSGGSRVSVMVGAGLSMNAVAMDTARPRMPDWRGLTTELGKRLVSDDAARQRLFDDAGAVAEGYMRLAQYFESKFGRPALDQFIISEISDALYQPGPLHCGLLILPWREVFTTNWDTLLERAATELADPVYFPVTQPDQLMTAGHPRIVKLHGCVDKAPRFVFTEEDYRRYPQTHSTFVTVVRNALLEGPLCLVGFSGEDPNFRQWVGWVRDKTPEQHPLYLLHVSEQPLADFQINRLQAQGVTVLQVGRIGMMPAESLNHVLDFMREGTARTWPGVLEQLRTELFDPSEALSRLRGIADAYPGWLVCPTRHRERLATRLSLRALPKAGDMELGERVEYLCRKAEVVGWLGVPMPASERALVDETLSDYAAVLEGNLALQSALSLAFTRLTDAIHELDLEGAARTFSILDVLVQRGGPAHRERLKFERALFSFRTLDRRGAADSLRGFTSSDPFLQARVVALRLELEADEAAVAALHALRRRVTHLVRQFPHSERHASLEDVVTLLFEKERMTRGVIPRNQHTAGGDAQIESDGRSVRRRALECDITSEIRYISAMVGQPPHAAPVGTEYRAGFRAGSFSSTICFGQSAVPAERYAYQMARIPDTVGLLVSCNAVGLLTEPLEDAVRWLETINEAAALALILRLIATGRPKSVSFLQRSTVARLPIAVAQGVWPLLIASIEQGLEIAETLTKKGQLQNSLLEGCIGLAARLVIRLNSSAASTLLQLVFELSSRMPANRSNSFLKTLSDAALESKTLLGDEPYYEALLNGAMVALSAKGSISALPELLFRCRGDGCVRKSDPALVDLCVLALRNSDKTVRCSALYIGALLDQVQCLDAEQRDRIGDAIWQNDEWPEFGEFFLREYFAHLPGSNPQLVHDAILKNITPQSKPRHLVEAASLLAILNSEIEARARRRFLLTDELQEALIGALSELAQVRQASGRQSHFNPRDEHWERAFVGIVACDPRHAAIQAPLLHQGMRCGLLDSVAIVDLYQLGTLTQEQLINALTVPESEDPSEDWRLLLAIRQATLHGKLDSDALGRLLDEVSSRLRGAPAFGTARALSIAQDLVDQASIELPDRVIETWCRAGIAFSRTAYDDPSKEVREFAPTVRVAASLLLAGLVRRVPSLADRPKVETALDSFRNDPLPEVRMSVIAVGARS